MKHWNDSNDRGRGLWAGSQCGFRRAFANCDAALNAGRAVISMISIGV
jgi:hypothetical protein